MRKREGMQKAYVIGMFVFLLLLLGGIVLLNINSGNVKIPPDRILQILLTGEGKKNEVNIIWKLRLPRILMSTILGGALSLSGFLLQTYFHNPIAGPFVLGISSGAKMMVAVTMVFLLQEEAASSSFLLIGAAFVGALAATLLILLLSTFVKQMATLLVGGIMIGYICSALTDFLITFAQDADIVSLRGWSLGSFSGTSWAQVKLAFFPVAGALLLSFFLSKPAEAFQLGEAYARSMGVNTRLFKTALILLSSLLSACVTAFAGPISFVGIAVPFLTKGLFRTAKPLLLIPAVFLFGAVFCLCCDWIARCAFSPVELNISTVTSIFGAPVVILLLLSRQKDRG